MYTIIIRRSVPYAVLLSAVPSLSQSCSFRRAGIRFSVLSPFSYMPFGSSAFGYPPFSFSLFGYSKLC
jgi:hypothetical protein